MEQLDTQRIAEKAKYSAQEATGAGDAGSLIQTSGNSGELSVKLDVSKTASGLAALYSLMGSQDQGELNDAVAQEYFRAMSDIPQWAVDSAMKMYRDGKAGNGRFVPRPPELAMQARRLVEAWEERERWKRSKAEQQRQINEQIERNRRWKAHSAGVTDGSRARVQSMLEQTKQNLINANGNSEDSEKINVHQQTHDRFKDQARKDLQDFLECQLAEEQESFAK